MGLNLNLSSDQGIHSEKIFCNITVVLVVV